MKLLWYHGDKTETTGQLLRACKQAELGVKESVPHFSSSVSAQECAPTQLKQLS